MQMLIITLKDGLFNDDNNKYVLRIKPEHNAQTEDMNTKKSTGYH